MCVRKMALMGDLIASFTMESQTQENSFRSETHSRADKLGTSHFFLTWSHSVGLNRLSVCTFYTCKKREKNYLMGFADNVL